jgi:hypothetical protein
MMGTGRFVGALAGALAAALLATSPATAQQFALRSGENVIAGHPVQISLTGLPPNAEVEVTAERVLMDRWKESAPVRAYRSRARFRADDHGSVDVDQSPSLGGSFTGSDQSGLFWSMEPVDGAGGVSPSDQVKLTATIGGRTVATSSFRLIDRPTGVSVREVPHQPGSYFAAHPGKGKRPVVIVVDGVDGNSYSRDVLMPRLVAQGFSVFHFATYALVYGPGRPSVEGLPTRYVDIPVDRLEAVRDWIVKQPGVDPNRIGLYGVSRNGAYVLIAATRFPWVRAVAGIVPSDVVWEGWGDRVALGTTSSYSWRGKPLPFVPYDGEAFRRESGKIARGQQFRLRTAMDEGRWSNTHRVPPARIQLENYRGAVFVAGGELDNLWSSGHMVQNISERRAEAGLKTTTLVFADAGHNLGGDGHDPTMLFESGADRAAEARAQYRTWQSLVAFLKRALRPDRVS